MNRCKVLDCTLRDGGYCNQWMFGYENEVKIIKSLIEANIDIIECGLLTEEIHKKGSSRFQNINQIKEILPQKRKEKLFVCLLNYGEYDINKIPNYDKASVDGIRVAFHKKDRLKAIQECKFIKDKGYKVFVQPMVSLTYSREEFLELIYMVNQLEPYAFYIVDSFGMMKKNDVLTLFNYVEENLKASVQIGFHSHNNLQLAYSNALTLLDVQTQHEIIIDASIMGMGRGAGNLNTELFIKYLNEIIEDKYKVKPVLRVIDEVINIFHQRRYWGYSLPNYLSALHCAHPNYALYLSNKNTLKVENMNEIFSMMDENQKLEFNKKYIEEMYLEYMKKNIKCHGCLDDFLKNIYGKKILLIAPGKTSEDEYEKVIKFASASDVISISINFEYAHYSTNYIFLSNLRRCQNIKKNNRGKTITTSNLNLQDVFLQVNYQELLNEKEFVKDNAAMMLLKMLMMLGAKQIYLAGVDGYSYNTTDNYAKDYLQLVTSNEVLDAMNREMRELIRVFSRECKIEFITTNKYIYI